MGFPLQGVTCEFDAWGELAGAERTFVVQMSITRRWQPSACTFVQVASSNPFTTLRIELVALEVLSAGCAAARKGAACEPVVADTH